MSWYAASSRERTVARSVMQFLFGVPREGSCVRRRELVQRPCRTPGCARLLQPADHLDLQIADLLAQGVAVEAEQGRGADLVAARRRQGEVDQGPLDLAQHAVVDAGGRQPVAVGRE